MDLSLHVDSRASTYRDKLESFRRNCRRLIAVIILMIFAGSFTAQADESGKDEKVTLQLKWKHQFQFAGYYAAIEKGYYKRAGIEVKLVEAVEGVNPANAVTSGKAEFGICNSDILMMRSQKKNLVVLATIFQHSPSILLASKQSGITHVQDLIGKRIAIEPDAADLLAFLHDEGVTLDKCNVFPLSFDAKKLIDGKVDAISAYSSDETYTLRKAGFGYTVISPRMGGIDFYSDVLFTTEALLKKNPDLVNKFREASLKGWKYAMENPDEIINLIYNKYSQRHGLEHLRFEAAQMKNLIMAEVVEMGYSNPGRWESIADIYKELKLIEPAFTTKGLHYSDYQKPKVIISRKLVTILISLIIIISAATIFYYINTRKLKQEIKRRLKIEEALQQSEKQYRAILNASPDDITITDLEGRILMISPAALVMFGGNRAEDLTGRLLTEFIVPEDHDRAIANIALMFKGNQPGLGEYTGLRRDGGKINIEVNGDFIRDADGHPAKMIFVVRDITGHRRTEEALRQSEAKFRSYFELPSTGRAITSPGKGWVDVNSTLCYMLGYSKAELTQKTWAELTHPDDLAEDVAQFNRLIAGEIDGYTLDKRFINKSGGIVYAHIAVQCLRHQDGSVDYIVAIIIDITDRKKAEARIARQLGFAKTLNEIAEVIIAKDNAEEILENANRIIGETLQLDRILIYDVSFKDNQITGMCEWLSQPHPEIAPTKNRYPLDMFISPLTAIKNTRKHLESYFNAVNEHFIEDGSGKVLHEHFNIKSLLWYPFAFDEHGYYMFTINQILTLRQWQAEEIDFIDSVAKLVNMALIKIRLLEERKLAEAELIKAKEKAEENNRLKTAFLANMSHEIRTPMNGILGFTRLLSEPRLTGEEKHEYINIIQKSGERMLNTINDIINVAKVESRQMEVVTAETNVNEQLEYIHAFFMHEAGDKGLQLSFKSSLTRQEAMIITDEEKIYAVLTNLIKNAIKFTDKGFIEFGCEKKGSLLEFYVKDTGIGIPLNRQDAVFERFVQADISDKRAFQGSGLGLTIAKSYVEMLGGGIKLESEEGKGSKFYFSIPYIAAKTEKSDETTATTPAAEHDDVRNDLKILIAEDDDKSEMLIRITIKKFCRDILTATTGIKTVELCRNHPDIDLILMDVKMPEMNGYEATKQIRKFNKDVVIIAQTAYALTGEREIIMQSGCNDYVAKPFKPEALTAILKKYFTRN